MTMSAELAYGKLGQPKIYTDQERKERKKEYYKKHYHAHKDKCNLSTKKSKLRAKGIVEWHGLDLTPRPRGRPKIYTEEELKQRRRDQYKNHYCLKDKEASIERTKKSCMCKKLMAQLPQPV